MRKLFLSLIALALIQFANAQTIGNQQLVDLHISATQKTKALVYTPDNVNTYPTFFFFYGLGHTADKADSTLLDQGPARIIAKGWKPKFNIISVQVPAKDGWYFSEYQFNHMPSMDAVITDAISKYKINVNKMYLMGISAGGAAIVNYVGLKSFTPKYKIAAVIAMSAAMSTVPNSANFDPSILDIRKIAGVIPFWGEGSTSNDPQGYTTQLFVNAINLIKPGAALWTPSNAGCHCEPTWAGFYDSSSQVYDWALQYSTNNIVDTVIIKPPVDTTHHDTTIVTPPVNTAHKFYPADGNLNRLQLQPGDSVFLNYANHYDVVSLTNFKGDSLNPVVIINKGGQTQLLPTASFPNAGFYLVGSVGVKVTGTGSGDKYGFKIAGGGYAGISVEGRAAYQEFDHIDLSNKGVGVWIKQEQSLQDSLSFPNWVLNNFKIHDNYIHNCSLEGMYLGSTDPNAIPSPFNQHPLLDTIHKPLRLGNFKIYNNVIDSTGRGAIQLSDADHDISEIYNNIISNCGFELNGQQGNGVIIGSYTHAYLHDNAVKNTYSSGIMCFASGNIIKNNKIDSSGYLGGKIITGVASIYVDVRSSQFPSSQYAPYDSTSFDIEGNITGANTNGIGIFVEKSLDTYKRNGNILAGNKGIVFVRPGINYSTDTTVIPPVKPAPSPIKSFTHTGSTYTFYREDGSTMIVTNIQWARLNYKGVCRVLLLDKSQKIVE